jgi:hypothetical protein
VGGNEILQVGTGNTINLQNSDFNLTLGGNSVNFDNGVILSENSRLTVNTGTVNSLNNNLDIEIAGENSRIIFNTLGSVGSLDSPFKPPLRS